MEGAELLTRGGGFLLPLLLLHCPTYDFYPKTICLKNYGFSGLQSCSPLQNRLYFSTTPRGPPVLSPAAQANPILIPRTEMKAPGHVPNKGPQPCSGVQLMRLFNVPGTKQSSGDGILRTTTWGRRLALLTLITLLADRL